MSQQYRTTFEIQLQTFLSFNATSNLVSLYLLSSSRREKIARLSTTFRPFLMLAKDICVVGANCATICDDVNLYRDISLCSPVHFRSTSLVALPNTLKRSKVCSWYVEYLFYFAFKFNQITWTGIGTGALHLRENAVLSKCVLISPENDFGISLSRKLHKTSPFLIQLGFLVLPALCSCCLFLE